MAKFIEITVNGTNAYEDGKKLINVDGILGSYASSANQVSLASSAGQVSSIDLGVTAGKALEVLALIQSAMTANPGGVKAKVTLPTGVEITSLGFN